MSREFGEIEYDEDARLYTGHERDRKLTAGPGNMIDGQDSCLPVTSMEPELYIIENNLAPREEVSTTAIIEQNEGDAGNIEDIRNDQEDLAATELEARLLAARIKKLCGSQIYDQESKGLESK